MIAGATTIAATANDARVAPLQTITLVQGAARQCGGAHEQRRREEREQDRGRQDLPPDQRRPAHRPRLEDGQVRHVMPEIAADHRRPQQDHASGEHRAQYSSRLRPPRPAGAAHHDGAHRDRSEHHRDCDLPPAPTREDQVLPEDRGFNRTGWRERERSPSRSGAAWNSGRLALRRVPGPLRKLDGAVFERCVRAEHPEHVQQEEDERPRQRRPGTLLPIGRAPLARWCGTARARRQPVPSR